MKLIDFIKNDLFEILYIKCIQADRVYINSFLVIFLFINIVFLFHTVSFMYGNHTWHAVTGSLPTDNYLNIGRYSTNIIKSILFGGKYIPIISNLFGFAALSLSSILLCIYWDFKKKIHIFAICGCIFSIQPFVLEWLYYVEALPEFFLAPAFVFIGLILAEKISNYTTYKKYILFILSVVVINISISIYPVLLTTIAVSVIGKIFIECYKNYESNIISILNKFKYSLASIATSAILYKIFLIILKKNNILLDSYTIRSISIENIPERIYEHFFLSFEKLILYKSSFMPNLITKLFFVIFIVLTVSIIYKLIKYKNFKNFLLCASTLCLVIFATETSSIIADSNLIREARVDFYGIVPFRVLIVGLLLSSENIYKNLTFIITILIVFICSINDFYALRVWHSGYEAEKMQWNRILARMESHPNFIPGKKYHFIQIGENFSLRDKFYEKRKNEKVAIGSLGHSYTPHWRPLDPTKLFYPFDFYKSQLSSQSHANHALYQSCIKRLHDGGILDMAEAWPRPNSLLIHEDIILFVTNYKSLEQTRASLKSKEEK